MNLTSRESLGTKAKNAE